MPSRRQFLRAAAVALGGSVATAGCTNVPASSGDPGESASPPTSTTPEATDRTTTTGADSAPTTSPVQRERARGAAEPITVEETITDPEYEYVESNDTVRSPLVKSGDEVLEYGHESFDDWARGEGVDIGLWAVRDHLAERIDERVGSGISGGTDGSPVIYLRVTTRVDSDGNVVSEPDVSFTDLVAAAPRSVISTIHFAGKSATHTHEVWVRRVVRQND